MERAIRLADYGKGTVSPNPLVGCVIVKDGQIIGEGFHHKYGGPHAEVEAINAVVDKTHLTGSTVYVTLEPCSHYGKTPPCADLMIASKVARVVIAIGDPNPKVNGRGIQLLREAGIDVEVGVCEAAARFQNRRFFTFIQQHRPYIVLKWAQTSDGFMAKNDFNSKWISNLKSRQLVHKWRAEEDGILVGKNTALYDNPKLNLRDWHGKNPVRILIDHQLVVPNSNHLYDQTQPTLIYNLQRDASSENLTLVKYPEIGFLEFILNDIYQRGIQSVLVEGGAYTLKQFIDRDMWDEVRLFTSKNTFEAGISAPKLNLNPNQTSFVGEDKLDVYFNGRISYHNGN